MENDEDREYFYSAPGFCTTKKSALQDLQFMTARLLLTKFDFKFQISKIKDWSADKPTYFENFKDSNSFFKRARIKNDFTTSSR